MYYNGLQVEAQESSAEDDKYTGQPSGKPPVPVTPKILISSLKKLKKKAFKGLFFTPQQVTNEISQNFPEVEQDFQILLLEVSDKLACAAAAGLIGSKSDMGYYALDLRQQGAKADSKSELMFWLFYKRILDKKSTEEKNKSGDDRKQSSCNSDKEKASE